MRRAHKTSGRSEVVCGVIGHLKRNEGHEVTFDFQIEMAVDLIVRLG